MRFVNIKTGATLLLFCTAACASATARSSAVFCQQVKGEHNVFAAEMLKDRNLKFGLSKWQSDGQNFGVFGIAKAAGKRWVYRARSGGSACHVTIDWHGSEGAAIAVDPNASCDADAGYGFAVKSARFQASDFKAPVRMELKDSETFFNSDPCGSGQ